MPGVRQYSGKIKIFSIRDRSRNFDRLSRVRLNPDTVRTAIDLCKNIKSHPGSSGGFVK